MTDSRFTGKVEWFSPKKGFGFISRDDNEKDLFVHYSNISMEGYKELKAGQLVSFGIGKNNRGPQAIEVEILG